MSAASQAAPLAAELLGQARVLRGELEARNVDNVARTRSYLEAYALTLEGGADWPWLLMAHLVSRNAGYLMVDVALAIEHDRRVFTPAAMLDLFAMLERANFLIFFDAWHHVMATLTGDSVACDPRTPVHMQRAYAGARGPGAAEQERRLVLDLVTNEQNFIERRVVRRARFGRGMALVDFFERTGNERPMVLPVSPAKIKVGGFADLERRVDTGRRIFDEVLADRGLRAEIYAWARETPHTGARADHGGKPGPSLRDVWPVARVLELDPELHAPPEPDPLWP